MKVKFKRLTYTAKIPTRATPGSVGLDLYATTHVRLEPWRTAKIPVGIAVEIPPGYEGQVRGRSGLAMAGLVVHQGTIDSDYRGEVGVIVLNSMNYPIKLKQGDRIAQLVIAPIADVEPVEAVELSETERGAGGFGSTGA